MGYFKGKGGGSGSDLELLNFSQRIDNFFGNSIGKVFHLSTSAPINKRKYGDGFIVLH
jgi:hypothetical protein